MMLHPFGNVLLFGLLYHISREKPIPLQKKSNLRQFVGRNHRLREFSTNGCAKFD